jgi:hypothetical protein
MTYSETTLTAEELTIGREGAQLFKAVLSRTQLSELESAPATQPRDQRGRIPTAEIPEVVRSPMRDHHLSCRGGRHLALCDANSSCVRCRNRATTSPGCADRLRCRPASGWFGVAGCLNPVIIAGGPASSSCCVHLRGSEPVCAAPPAPEYRDGRCPASTSSASRILNS